MKTVMAQLARIPFRPRSVRSPERPDYPRCWLADFRFTSGRRTLLHWFLFGIIMVALQACLGCSSTVFPFFSSQSPNTVRIGILDSLTGSDADSGRATVDAAELAVVEINQAGGLTIDHRQLPVELVIKDAQSRPETAIGMAQTLINQENVVAIVGPQYSRYAIPVSELAEQAQIPMITPRSTNPKTTAGKQYVFRTIFVDTFQGQVVAQFAYRDLRAKRAAVLYDIASPYNQGIASVFQRVFTQQGGTVVAIESYTTGDQSFTTQLQAIRAQRPDVLFLPNYANEVPLQATQARRLGIQAILLGADAWGGVKEADRSVLEGAYFSDHYIPEARTEAAQRFIQRYQQTYGTPPGATAAATYDSMGLLFQAIERQGSTDPEAIRQELANFGRYEGVTGSLEFRGTGDPVVSIAILHIEDGRVSFYKEIEPQGLESELEPGGERNVN